MKKEIAALFFYMLYMVAMMRPVMPILEYYANYEYVATVLCKNRDRPALACNGKCYLQKEMKKVSVSDTSPKHQHNSTLPQIDFSKYPVAPLESSGYMFRPSFKKNKKKWNTPFGKTNQFVYSLFRPPLTV